jgi:hypothetical protein
VGVRYEKRLKEMMAQAEVSPDAVRGLLGRLETFVLPFCVGLPQPGMQRHAAQYMTGLLSDLGRKTAEGIAYLLDQDRQPLQRFIGQADWDHRPPLMTLAQQVGSQLGQADGVIVFDPSAFAKKGEKSVGVARQWCGRLGKVENCQVGVYMGYVSRTEHTLVNFRLYLPEEWAKDKARRKEAGVPSEVRFQTRHELALEMLKECGHHRKRSVKPFLPRRLSCWIGTLPPIQEPAHGTTQRPQSRTHLAGTPPAAIHQCAVHRRLLCT